MAAFHKICCAVAVIVCANSLFGESVIVPNQLRSTVEHFELVENFKLAVFEDNSVHVKFSAYEREFDFHAVGHDAKHAYKAKFADGGWARVFVYPDQTIHAVIKVDEHTYVVDPVAHHAASATDNAASHMEENSADMLVYRLDALDLSGLESGSHENTWAHRSQVSTRSVIDACFSKQRKLTLGIAVDSGYQDVLKSQGIDVLTHLSALVNTMDGIYQESFNTHVVLGPVFVHGADEFTDWNEFPRTSGRRTCNIGISQKLSLFSAWRGCCSDETGKTPDQRADVWVLLTDCYPGPGVVGLANTGQVCVSDTIMCVGCTQSSCDDCAESPCPLDAKFCSSGTAVVSNEHGMTWFVLVHETAHVLGAHHDKEGFMSPYANRKNSYFSTKSLDSICKQLHHLHGCMQDN